MLATAAEVTGQGVGTLILRTLLDHAQELRHTLVQVVAVSQYAYVELTDFLTFHSNGRRQSCSMPDRILNEVIWKRTKVIDIAQVISLALSAAELTTSRANNFWSGDR